MEPDRALDLDVFYCAAPGRAAGARTLSAINRKVGAQGRLAPHWDVEHQLYCDVDAPPILPPATGKKEKLTEISKCRAAGMCICRAWRSVIETDRHTDLESQTDGSFIYALSSCVVCVVRPAVVRRSSLECKLYRNVDRYNRTRVMASNVVATAQTNSTANVETQ